MSVVDGQVAAKLHKRWRCGCSVQIWSLSWTDGMSKQRQYIKRMVFVVG
jgi:hypothetical protein